MILSSAGSISPKVPCSELRVTVSIGVGKDKSIDPFPLDDLLSSKPRIIGSYRDELSPRILTPSETITFAIPPFLGNVMPAINARGVARSLSGASQSTLQSSSQSSFRVMVLPL
jgi:hypothetical protein